MSIDLHDPELFVERAYVTGEWTAAGFGRVLPVEDPATGEVIGSVRLRRRRHARVRFRDESEAIELANATP